MFDLLNLYFILVVPHNKQKALFNKYCNELGEKIKNDKKNKKVRASKGYLVCICIIFTMHVET